MPTISPVVFHGNPVITIDKYPEASAAEVTVCSTVSYEDRKYGGFPILKLFIQHKDGKVPVYATYPPFLPNLEAIPAFRQFLTKQLTQFNNTEAAEDPILIRTGISQYLFMLENYSVVGTLVQQARECATLLDTTHRLAEARARGIINAVQETPQCDTPIQFESA